MECAIPHIEIADNTYTTRIWRPYCEIRILHPVNRHRVCAEFFIDIIIFSFCEQISIKIRNLRFKCIAVSRENSCTILISRLYTILVPFYFLFWKINAIQPIRKPIHLNRIFAGNRCNANFFGMRPIYRNNLSLTVIMYS